MDTTCDDREFDETAGECNFVTTSDDGIKSRDNFYLVIADHNSQAEAIASVGLLDDPLVSSTSSDIVENGNCANNAELSQIGSQFEHTSMEKKGANWDFQPIGASDGSEWSVNTNSGNFNGSEVNGPESEHKLNSLEFGNHNKEGGTLLQSEKTNKLSCPVVSHERSEIYFPSSANSAPAIRNRRNSLANSADYLKKLSLNARNKTSTSVKKISSFIPFRKAPHNDEFDDHGSGNGSSSVENTPPKSRRKQGAFVPPSPVLDLDIEDQIDSDMVLRTSESVDAQPSQTELEKSDPDFVQYFQKYTADSDKDFIRKYLHLKQNLELKLAKMEAEYMKLLRLEPSEELQLTLNTLESTQGDDLIFHCVNLFESHENPEKVVALSIHREYEGYIRALHKCVFENVFKLINIKTLQNSINSKLSQNDQATKTITSPQKKKTQVFESNVFDSDPLTNNDGFLMFSTAQFLSPLKPGVKNSPCNHDVATLTLKEFSEEQIDPFMVKASKLHSRTERVSLELHQNAKKVTFKEESTSDQSAGSQLDFEETSSTLDDDEVMLTRSESLTSNLAANLKSNGLAGTTDLDLDQLLFADAQES